MKRTLLILLAVFICFSLTACFGETESMLFGSGKEETAQEPEDAQEQKPEPAPPVTEKPEQESTLEPTPEQTEEPIESVQPTQDLPWLPKPPETPQPPADASQQTIVFMDMFIDILIVVDIPNWTYSTELYDGEVFFYPEDDLSGNTGFAISSYFKSEDTTEDVWRDFYTAMEAVFADFKWESEEDIAAGEYTAQRYSFASADFKGDYFLWYSKERLYICSFTATEDEYEQLYPLVTDALSTFIAVSEMNE